MAIETQGTRFYWCTSTTFTTALSVAGIQSISGPSGSNPEIDVTTFDSSAREFLLGLKDEGSLSIEMVRDTSSTGQGAMIADNNSRTQRAWGIDFSTHVIEASVVGARITGFGYVSGWSYSMGADDAVKVSASVRITGAINTTKGTS